MDDTPFFVKEIIFIGIHRSRKNRSHTLSYFRTCRRTRVCFEKPGKIFAALPSAEKYMRIVLAIEAREGPKTSRQSRASHGDDWPPLRGDDGHLSFTRYCWQGGDYTTTTTAARTPTPCTPIALPDADPTSCLGRVNHDCTKWVMPPQSENTALHGCVYRQSHHDSQHGTHRSMRMYQTPSQGQGVEAIVQTSSTHAVMSVGLVERPIPSALLSKPSTTAAPETAARPVSLTMLVFLTTSWWDSRQTLADSTLDNVAGDPRSANLRWALRPHCKGGVRPHIRVERVFGILHAVFER